jgi:hypothetical protein
MSKQSDFFVYLIEHYAEAKKTNAQEVLRHWDSLKLTDLIYEMYELYHVERLENAFDDIDALILERQG